MNELSAAQRDDKSILDVRSRIASSQSQPAMQEFRFTDPEGSLFASFYCPLIRSTADEKDFGRTGAKTLSCSRERSQPLSVQLRRAGEERDSALGWAVLQPASSP